MSPEKNRIELLDYARGFAILSIVLYHYGSQLQLPGILNKIMMLGGTGGHLFIFLSGFGLTLTAKRVDYTFYKRRLFRIYVPYVVIITAIALSNTILPIYKDGFYAYLGHILLFKMFDNTIVGSYGQHLWFISTIFQFYLVYPLLYSCMHRLGNARYFSLMVLVSIIYWIMLVQNDLTGSRVWNSSCLQFLWEFALAMVLADQYGNTGYRFWEQDDRLLIVSAVVGLGLYGSLALFGGKYGRIFNDIPALFGYGAFCILTYHVIRNRSPYLTSIFVRISGMSYFLYLTHVYIMDLVSIMLPENGSLRMVVFGADVIAAVAVADFTASIFDTQYRKNYHSHVGRT